MAVEILTSICNLIRIAVAYNDTAMTEDAVVYVVSLRRERK